jgi:hypothetical protein
MSRQSSDLEQDGDDRSGATGVSRSALADFPELHGVSPEDPRKLRGPESAQMRPLLMIVLVMPSFAQAPAAAPVPTTAEPWITGWIDLGYRWRTDVGGSFDTYRTFVDLGSGPKLLGTEFTLIDPTQRFFDKIRVRAYSWGGEPYETFHLDAEKSKLYRFSADYRDIAYFDFLPSYADPLLSRGIILNEQSFDTRRKMGSFELDLLPANWIIPYLGYEFNSGSGSGATAFITNANQFPVPNTLYDLTNLYRGGVRIELRRFQATLEEGGTTFKNDQSLFQNPGSTNYGNVSTPVLGQITSLTSLLAAYGIRGTSYYTKALLTANAASWLDIYGQFLYSQPKTDVNYQQSVTGNLLLTSPLLFYTSQSYLLSAAAKLPHTTGSLSAEERPLRRVRILQTWLTDRLHNAGSADSNNVVANSSTSQQIASLLNSSLVNNYNQVEIDLFYDATSKLAIRGGYRYVWGDVSEAVLPPAGLVSADRAKLRRNLGLGGLIYRPMQKLSLTAEAEAASSGAVYFRTSLNNYQRVRAQARYQALKALSVTGDFTALLNGYPVPGVNSDYRAQQQSISLLWTPTKIWSLQGGYTRATVNSNIDFLDPGTLQPEKSRYRDNAHTATGLFNLNLPRGGRMEPNITAGGSLFISSGSRPSQYFQPIVTLRLSLLKEVIWFAEWRYYGYGETFYPYENFHAHLLTTGLRFKR